MKYIWEEKDIIPGRFVCYDSVPPDTNDMDSLTSVLFQIAIDPAECDKVFLISTTCGAPTKPDTPAEWLKSLNGERGFGYRPCTSHELYSVINYKLSNLVGIL